MTSAQPARQTSSRSRWWTGIALVMVVQAGLVFWLSDKTVRAARPSSSEPVIQFMKGDPFTLLPLSDPTLFVLPHREGFAGEGWMNTLQRTNEPMTWKEPLRYLDVTSDQLGAVFRAFVRTNRLPAFPRVVFSAPNLTYPALPVTGPVSIPSKVMIAGDLAGRPLLTPFHPPPQTYGDVLSNSVVRVVVDARGHVLSYVLLSGSGKSESDQLALEFAKAARFGPVKNGVQDSVGGPAAGLTLGRMIFQWQTAPESSANTPPAVQ